MPWRMPFHSWICRKKVVSCACDCWMKNAPRGAAVAAFVAVGLAVTACPADAAGHSAAVPAGRPAICHARRIVSSDDSSSPVANGVAALSLDPSAPSFADASAGAAAAVPAAGHESPLDDGAQIADNSALYRANAGYLTRSYRQK